MILIASRVPEPAVRRLTATLYGYAFLSDLVLLYPLYVVFFADTGLSVGQIASLFVIWSAAGILFEVPSGAWADVLPAGCCCVSPRWWPPPVRVWVLLPSYPAFAVGSCSGAPAANWSPARWRRWSGPSWTGSARSAGTPGCSAGTDRGCAGRGGLRSARRPGARRRRVPCGRRGQRARLPARHDRRHPLPGTPRAGRRTRSGGRAGDGRPPGGRAAPQRSRTTPASPDDDSDLGWWDTLRAGVSQVRTRPPVRAAVLLVAVVAADWGALDEYTPLLALDTGVGRRPYPCCSCCSGPGRQLAGCSPRRGSGWAAEGRRAAGAGRRRAGRRRPGAAPGGVRAARGGLRRGAVGHSAGRRAAPGPDHRHQPRHRHLAAGMATDVLIIATYAGYGLLATTAGNAVAFALTAGAYLVVGLVLLTRRRRRTVSAHRSAAAVPAARTDRARRRPPRAAAGPRCQPAMCRNDHWWPSRSRKPRMYIGPLAIPGPSDSPPATAAWSTSSSTCPRLDADSPTIDLPAGRRVRARRPRCTPRSPSGGAAPAGWCRRWRAPCCRRPGRPGRW